MASRHSWLSGSACEVKRNRPPGLPAARGGTEPVGGELVDETLRILAHDALQQRLGRLVIPELLLRVRPFPERGGGKLALRIALRDELVYRIGRGRVPALRTGHEGLRDLELRLGRFERVW